MDKKEFLNTLKEDLSSLSEDERQNALKYYEEYFADAAEDAKGEPISQFISPEDLAKKIEAELAAIADHEAAENAVPDVPPHVNTAAGNGVPDAPPQYQSKSGSNALKIILILCSAPLWFPLVIALASTAFGLFMALLGVAFAVASIALAGFIMVGAGFICVGYGAVNLFVDVTRALYPLGAGFIVAGVGLIMGYGFAKLTALMFKSQFKFAGWALRGIKKRFN